jgi:hypothetical protein
LTDYNSEPLPGIPPPINFVVHGAKLVANPGFGDMQTTLPIQQLPQLSFMHGQPVGQLQPQKTLQMPMTPGKEDPVATYSGDRVPLLARQPNIAWRRRDDQI